MIRQQKAGRSLSKNTPPFNYNLNVCKRHDIKERVAIHHDDIGELPGLDRT